MKAKVLAIGVLLLSCNNCHCIEYFTPFDLEFHPESATFGESSRHDEFPFMTALGWTNEESGEIDFLCGGMLISKNFVLTAAHCLLFERKLPNMIKIGGNKLNSTYNEEHTIRHFFIHPWYVDTQAYHDIALLQLAETSNKAPVCLWSRPQLRTSRVTALGYGATKFAGSNTPILQKVNLIIVSSGLCSAYHERKRKFRFGIADGQICAGDPGGRQDTCQGDSGGPLIVTMDYRQYAVGIISAGQACFGFPPSIYTRISAYLVWIANILQQYSESELQVCY